MNGHLLPTDQRWTDDNALMADLSHLNTEITRYILSFLDADAGRAKPISTDDEHTLGLKIAELGERVQHRAAEREAKAGGCIVEGEATRRWALEPSREPDTARDP